MELGSITEKLSAYVDHCLRPLVPRIPSYISDTTHVLKLLFGIKLTSADLLATTDVNSLYTSIPHN